MSAKVSAKGPRASLSLSDAPRRLGGRGSCGRRDARARGHGQPRPRPLDHAAPLGVLWTLRLPSHQRRMSESICTTQARAGWLGGRGSGAPPGRPRGPCGRPAPARRRDSGDPAPGRLNGSERPRGSPSPSRLVGARKLWPAAGPRVAQPKPRSTTGPRAAAAAPAPPAAAGHWQSPAFHGEGGAGRGPYPVVAATTRSSSNRKATEILANLLTNMIANNNGIADSLIIQGF